MSKIFSASLFCGDVEAAVIAASLREVRKMRLSEHYTEEIVAETRLLFCKIEDFSPIIQPTNYACQIAINAARKVAMRAKRTKAIGDEMVFRRQNARLQDYQDAERRVDCAKYLDEIARLPHAQRDAMFNHLAASLGLVPEAPKSAGARQSLKRARAQLAARLGGQPRKSARGRSSARDDFDDFDVFAEMEPSAWLIALLFEEVCSILHSHRHRQRHVVCAFRRARSGVPATFGQSYRRGRSMGRERAVRSARCRQVHQIPDGQMNGTRTEGARS